MPKFAIFDLDGTLIDSFPTIFNSLNMALKELGCPQLNPALERNSHELGDLFKEGFDMAATQGVDKTVLKETFDNIYSQHCLENIRLIPDTIEILKRHQQDGTQIVILTNKRQDIAEKICSNVNLLSKLMILGRVGVKPLKSDLPIVRCRLKYRGLIANNCSFYYGDSVEDERLSNMLRIPFYNIIQSQQHNTSGYEN